MSWFLVVLLASTDGSSWQEGFLWYDPKHASDVECTEWASSNTIEILRTVNYYYTEWTVDKTYCVREDRLEDLGISPLIENSQSL